jgi:hypothetical protein
VYNYAPTVAKDIDAPKLFQGVMVSSSFVDLKQHRAKLIRQSKAKSLRLWSWNMTLRNLL